MKILISATRFLPFRGGIENSIDALSQHFADMGHDVTLLVSDMVPVGIAHLPPDPVHPRIKLLRYHRPRVKGWMQLIGLVFQMVNIWRADDGKYDLVICRDIESAFPLFLKKSVASRIYIAPACFYKQNLSRLRELFKNGTVSSLTYCYNRYWYLPIVKLLQIGVIQLADKVTAWSENTLVDLGNCPLSPHLKYMQINPGVDLKKFTPLNPHTRNKCLHLLMLCRLDPVKNIEDALFAVQLCTTPVRLNIYGDGVELKRLKDLAADLGIVERVNFAGQTDKPEKVYPDADYFLMLSLYEPFGQTMIEAMACGVPVIAYQSGESHRNAAAEVFTDEFDGHIVQPTPKALARKFDELSRLTYKHRFAIRCRARKKITEHYSWTHTVQTLLDISRTDNGAV